MEKILTQLKGLSTGLFFTLTILKKDSSLLAIQPKPKTVSVGKQAKPPFIYNIS